MNPEIVTNIGTALTVVALVIAVWQAFLGRSQSNKLEKIADSLSTRYLGVFPRYLSRITDLIRSAQDEILIVCVIPTHGVWTDEQSWIASKRAIEDQRLSHRAKVSAVFSDSEHRRSFLLGQFRAAFEDWDNWRNNAQNHTKTLSLIERFGDRKQAEALASALSVEGFLDLLELANAEALEKTFPGAVQVPYHIPLNMWIADGVEAIFVIPEPVPKFAAHAFWTKDKDLIRALVGMHEEYLSQAGQKSILPSKY